jgi:acetyl-CoA carboxylase/biotin carboxylase 1
MKMYLPLVAANDGVVQLVKQPGVSIDAGDILATLTLDDPARVKRAKPFEGPLPALVTQQTVEGKPNQRFVHGLGVLQNILEGFDNQTIMTSTLMQLIDSLHDPELPYFQLNDILSSLVGRLPATLEGNIRSAIGAAKSRGAVHEFPAVEISEILEHHAQHNVPPQDRAMFRSSLSAIYDLSKRFMGGLQGHETEIIANLLERYESTEKLFEGSIEARVLVLRDQYRDDLDTVASLFFSHLNAQSKTKLVLALLDYVKTSGLDVANAKSRLNAVLRSLAALKAT